MMWCVRKERGAYDLLSRSAAAVSEITPHVSRIDDVWGYQQLTLSARCHMQSEDDDDDYDADGDASSIETRNAITGWWEASAQRKIETNSSSDMWYGAAVKDRRFRHIFMATIIQYVRLGCWCQGILYVGHQSNRRCIYT